MGPYMHATDFDIVVVHQTIYSKQKQNAFAKEFRLQGVDPVQLARRFSASSPETLSYRSSSSGLNERFKLDGSIIANFNYGACHKSHAIAGVTCGGERFLYNGWFPDAAHVHGNEGLKKKSDRP
eukprot:8435324-Pyramimonas_sp.AAC.1